MLKEATTDPIGSLDGPLQSAKVIFITMERRLGRDSFHENEVPLSLPVRSACLIVYGSYLAASDNAIWTAACPVGLRRVRNQHPAYQPGCSRDDEDSAFAACPAQISYSAWSKCITY